MLILIIGSAPDAIEAQSLEEALFQRIVTINNAWNIRNDWDFVYFPDDFPDNRRPNWQQGTKINSFRAICPNTK